MCNTIEILLVKVKFILSFSLCIFVFVFQSQKLHVQTKGGKVICLGTIYGNIDIHASDKSVRLTLFFFKSNFSFTSSWLKQWVGSTKFVA